MFNQKLNFLNNISIACWGVWIVFVTFSKSGLSFSEMSWNYILSCLEVLLMAVLQVLKDAIKKYYFWFGENDVNIIHFKAFHDVVLYTLIIVFGVFWLWGDFNYSSEVLLFSTLWGVLHILVSLFHNFTVVRSMAGPSEVLLATSHSMHICLDFFIFGGEVNTMQIIGVIFSFLSTVWVIYGNKH